MKTIELTKSAPRWKSVLAIADAAYEHDDDAAPKSVARPISRGPRRPSTPPHVRPRHERLHRAREPEAEDQGPQRRPEHEEALAQRVGDVDQHVHLLDGR